MRTSPFSLRLENQAPRHPSCEWCPSTHMLLKVTGTDGQPWQFSCPVPITGTMAPSLHISCLKVQENAASPHFHGDSGTPTL